MASRYNSLKSLKYPVIFCKMELTSKVNSSIFLDFYNSKANYVSFKVSLLKFSNTSHKTKIFRECVVTGRMRATIGYFSFSRFALKSRAVKGLVTGLKKSSW